MKPKKSLRIRRDLKFFDDRDGSAKDIMPRATLVTVALDIALDIALEALAALFDRPEFYKFTLVAYSLSFVGLFPA